MGKFFLPKATTAERTGLTPDDGTILYDETEQMLYFGDGSTAGGNTLQGDVGPQGPPGTLTAVVDDTSPQLGGFLDPNGNFIGMDKGGDLASASPLIIGTDGDHFDVTGTTGFAIMTVVAKRFFILQFDGALVVTHGASIVIPGGANFTTSPGDQFQCFSIAANTVRIVAITRADGTPVAINLVDDTSPQLGNFLDPNGNYIGVDKGSDLASASPLVLGIDGDFFDVTGTTGFSNITVANNRRFRLQFDGVLAITVGAGITLNNGGSNFTTAVGDIIDFQSVTANVVVGTIVKADGTSPVSAASEGRVLITETVATSQSSLEFTGIDNTYKKYEIDIINATLTSDNQSFKFQVGTGAGPTFQTTNYAHHVINPVSSSSAYVGSASASNSEIPLHVSVGNAAGESLNAVISIYNPADTSFYTNIVLTGVASDQAGSIVAIAGGGRWESTVAVTATKLFSTSNISGTFKLYGIP